MEEAGPRALTAGRADEGADVVEAPDEVEETTEEEARDAAADVGGASEEAAAVGGTTEDEAPAAGRDEDGF